MKKPLLILSLLLTSVVFLYSQVPDKFNYQATLRDNAGVLLTSRDINVRISILQSDVLGSSVYTETHAVKTSDQGIINLHIGAGNTSDELSSVNWFDGPYFLKIEIDPEGGDNYIHFGTSEILSVPLAISSKKAGSVEWNNIENKPDGVTGSYLDLSDKPEIPAEQWDTNGNHLYYNNGNVGIGTNEPIVKLNIVGNYEDGQERALIRLKNLATGPKASVSIALQAYDDKGISLAYTSPNYELNDLAEFGVMTTNGRGIALAPNIGQIRFYTNRNYDGSYSEKMRIDENGYVGIGTTTPSSLLSLVGNIETGAERNMFQLHNINETTMSYTGIKLKTGFSTGHSVIQDYGMTYQASTYYDFAGFLNVANSNRGVMLHANSAEGVIKFYTGHDDMMGAGLERMRIEANGNIGIGTDIVKSKLQVADGDIYISDINKGIIMTSPDGTCWRGTVNNTGALEFVSIPCPQ